MPAQHPASHVLASMMPKRTVLTRIMHCALAVRRPRPATLPWTLHIAEVGRVAYLPFLFECKSRNCSRDRDCDAGVYIYTLGPILG